MTEFSALRDMLCEHFSINDLTQLCYDLGIDSEILPNLSSGKPRFAQELIEFCRRRNGLDLLLAECVRNRPLVNWQEFHFPNQSKAIQIHNPVRSVAIARAENVANKPASIVQVILDGDINAFDLKRRQILKRTIAAVLDIDEEFVRIVRVEEGSIKVTLLVLAACEHLLENIRANPGTSETWHITNIRNEQFDSITWERLANWILKRIARQNKIQGWRLKDVDVQDIAQEVLVKCLAERPNAHLESNSKIPAELSRYIDREITIAARKILESNRYQVPLESIDSESVAFEETADTDTDSLTTIYSSSSSSSDLMSTFLSVAQDSHDKQIIEKRILHGNTFNEIASSLNLSPTQVRVRFHRLLKRVRNRIVEGHE